MHPYNRKSVIKLPSNNFPCLVIIKEITLTTVSVNIIVIGTLVSLVGCVDKEYIIMESRIIKKTVILKHRVLSIEILLFVFSSIFSL